MLSEGSSIRSDGGSATRVHSQGEVEQVGAFRDVVTSGLRDLRRENRRKGSEPVNKKDKPRKEKFKVH